MKQLLWTIQDEKAFREFERTGVLRANKDFLFCQEEFRFAYDWISNQMKRRKPTIFINPTESPAIRINFISLMIFPGFVYRHMIMECGTWLMRKHGTWILWNV